MEQTESENLGNRLLLQALRAEGFASFPMDDPHYTPIWDKLLRFSGNKTRHELLTDIGLGKRIANIVAKRLAHLLLEAGHKPDALLLTRERFAAQDSNGVGALILDGSESASVQFAKCCHPIPGDKILGYLGRGEGLVVHVHDCPVALKLRNKDSERFIEVDWSEEPVRPFKAGITVTGSQSKGLLAKLATALAAAEADIVDINMGQDGGQEARELRFLVSVRDTAHLEVALRNLRRTASVLKAERNGSGT
jgi:guanosine-3',5'-bis(diphosphate) 3'-pyrophosphohydrolase